MPINWILIGVIQKKNTIIDLPVLTRQFPVSSSTIQTENPRVSCETEKIAFWAWKHSAPNCYELMDDMWQSKIIKNYYRYKYGY